ncbi:ATP-grasp domain-containing protein [Planktothrix sp. FACHB-1355]|uniref:ATP-grasp domain-containing protein n=1 Tax=Aerosakkonema funiforme FACHB-1375 TaxID=2949571 RepID=A0A926ZHZ8_9CYAN|nr:MULTISPECIES: ATP-grasp domain-containing protein [Oscillatoriales]MBD2182722.1 ATP-grasp domain-containing protein [Aerosakkonema funiforme FACHB-1375]MBD3560931.1 ATP-grasp domain-containing protein [Planktothrix sp. FACHB-1355]
MPTLILTPRYTEDSQALWRAANRLGWRVQRLINWRLPDELKLVCEPVLYVEALMTEMIAEQLGLRLIDPPNDWLPNLPEEYRKRWVYLSTLGEARCMEKAAFIKPPNDKSFPARVYQSEELPSDYPDEIPVLIAEIVEWEKEFRCFILNRSLKTFSIYLRDGELQRQNDFAHTEEEECEVREFIEILLSDEQVEILEATVIDVGVIKGRGWAVVEQNAAWGAGLYGCDPIEVLEVLRYAVVRA